jgi:hypothetical protein
VLSLLVIPSVFTVMDDFEHWMGRVKRWVLRDKGPDDTSKCHAI